LHVFDPGAIAGNTRGQFDNVDYVDGLPGLVAHPQPTVVPHGAVLLVSGWTVDPVTNGSPLATCVLLDRALPLAARTGIARGDIMLAHKTEEFVGYQLVVPTGNLGSGAHELRTYALSVDGCWYESAVAGFRLFHHHSAMHGKGTVARELIMSVEIPTDLATGVPVAPETPIHADRSLRLRGWAFDQARGIGAETIVATDENGRTWSGPATVEDPIARETLGAGDERLGFEITIPAALFGRGRHRLQLSGLDATGRRYANSLKVQFDVISATRPFPLTARVARTSPPFAAHFRVVRDALGAHDLRPIRFQADLPCETVIVVSPNDQLVVEGWAIDESGAGADEVFIELTPTWLGLPPHRHPTECAQRKVVDGLSAAPVEDAWFRFMFGLPELSNASYAIALVVVQPGRRTYSRVPLANIKVG
jgi:hypothetical protein